MIPFGPGPVWLPTSSQRVGPWSRCRINPDRCKACQPRSTEKWTPPSPTSQGLMAPWNEAIEFASSSEAESCKVRRFPPS